VTPLFSIKWSYLTPSTCSAGIFPFGTQIQDLLITDYNNTANICGKPVRRNWLVRFQYAIYAQTIFILIHLSLSSGTMSHHLMLQNQTPFMAWVVGDPHAGAFTWFLDSFGALVQKDHTLTGRIQYSLAGLVSSCEHPKAQGSCSGSLSCLRDRLH
jgi:hypothetical protein